MKYPKRMILFFAVLAPSLATAQPKISKDSEHQTIAHHFFKLMQEHRSTDALDSLTPWLLEAREALDSAKAEGVVYCISDQADALAYTVLASKGKQQATLLGPSVCAPLYLRAFALTDARRYTEAIQALEEMSGLAPFNAQYLIELAFAYGQTGQLERADEHYRKAYAIADLAQDKEVSRKRRAAAKRGLGWVLVEKGQLDAAAASYRQSLEDDPGNAIANQELEFIRQLKAGKPSG